MPGTYRLIELVGTSPVSFAEAVVPGFPEWSASHQVWRCPPSPRRAGPWARLPSIDSSGHCSGAAAATAIITTGASDSSA